MKHPTQAADIRSGTHDVEISPVEEDILLKEIATITYKHRATSPVV